MGHAELLVGMSSDRNRGALARRIAVEGLSVRATETLLRSAREGAVQSTDSNESEKDPDLIRLERLLTETLGSTTYLDMQAGTVVIDYGQDLDVLDGVLQRLGIQYV